jgi:hypothetical protein
MMNPAVADAAIATRKDVMREMKKMNENWSNDSFLGE